MDNGWNSKFHNQNFEINEQGKNLSKKVEKILNYKDILKICDIGFYMQMLELELLKINKFKFPNKLKIIEDYVLWLKILKKISHMGMD